MSRVNDKQKRPGACANILTGIRDSYLYGFVIVSRRLSLGNAILLYAAAYVLVALGIHLAFFPIGDIGVESDFFGELVVAAKELVQLDFSVANYPYKGPFYSFALVFVHLFCRDWYLSGVVINGLCAAASLIVIFLLLAKIYDRTIAFLAMLAVSVGYEFFSLAHKASSDMLFLLMCYCAINILFMERFSWWRLIAGGILSAFAFLTRYTGIFLPAALVVMFLINPGRWSRRRCLAAALTYLAVFFAVCAPWFAKNVHEAGSLLATRNIENVVKEFYGDRMAAEVPTGGFKSILQVFTYDPAYFIKHYLLNIAEHFWMDMTSSMGVEIGILVYFGIIRLFFRLPTRKQWAFLAFPVCYFLVICTVFLIPRFSLPLTPVYHAIMFSMLIGLRGMPRFPLIGALKRIRMRKSKPAQKEYTEFARKDRDGRKAAPSFALIRVVVIGLIAAVFFFQIKWVIETERYYYKQRPLYILEAARFLKECAAREHRTEKAIVMARKPHIAYYADLVYKPYPRSLSYLPELIVAARNLGVDYLVCSDIERSYFGDSEAWQQLGMIKGIKKIYSMPSITIYELAYETSTAGRRAIRVPGRSMSYFPIINRRSSAPPPS